jgi:hypothetical protein
VSCWRYFRSIARSSSSIARFNRYERLWIDGSFGGHTDRLQKPVGVFYGCVVASPVCDLVSLAGMETSDASFSLQLLPKE